MYVFISYNIIIMYFIVLFKYHIIAVYVKNVMKKKKKKNQEYRRSLSGNVAPTIGDECSTEICNVEC